MMAVLTDFSVSLTNIFFALVFPLVLGLAWKWKTGQKLPPGPYGLPVLGYLPFLGNEPFRTLHELTETYGNIFSLYLGQTYVVILGDYDAVKDAFSKSTTLDRPEHIFDLLPGGVGFSSVNGKEWVEQRRYSVRAMRNLGLGKGTWESIITEEVQDFIKTVQKYNGEPMDVCAFLTTSVSNNIASLVLGKRLAWGDPKREFLNQSIDAVSQFFAQTGVRNYFPKICNFLAKIGIGGFDKWNSKMVAFNDYIKQEVRERQSLMVENRDPENFVDGYLEEMKIQQEKNEETTFNDTNLYGNIQALLVGGSDTTRTSLNWLLLAMAGYPEIQRKVQEELDNVLGQGKVASWDDRSSLPYTYATIMEAQRWKTIAPLNTSRIAQEDIQICGYDVPKGSVIIANNWGLHHDKRYWRDSDSFVPERFLKKDGTVNLKPNSYVPFSYGKRNCPGETVAMMEILLYLSGILGNFDVISAEQGAKPNFEANLGLTYQAVDQKLRLVHRNNQ